MNQVTDTEKFLFDIQGYLILRGAIDGDLIDALDFAVVQNEAFDHDESWADGLPIVTAQHFIKDNNIEHQVRLNGLPRLDPIFDQLIGHPSILPYLKEFIGDPGDVMIFTEALTHAGAAKTTTRRRTTLQYNHVHRDRACPMWDHHNARHYWIPPSIRERFKSEQRELTRWMDYTIPDRSVSGSERIND